MKNTFVQLFGDVFERCRNNEFVFLLWFDCLELDGFSKWVFG